VCSRASSGLIQRGIRFVAARKSARAASTAMQRRLPNAFVVYLGHPYELGFDLRMVPERLLDPLRWMEPRMIFVNSMSDLFHEKVRDEYIEQVCQVMEAANWHTYQVLTKRANRLRSLLNGSLRRFSSMAHVWWGVSVENRKHGVPRIHELRNTHVPTRFLSIEPLLEDIGTIDLCEISWVIVGGESGPRARPMDHDWVRSIRDQCVKGRVSFFFKQWGGVRKKEAGRTLDGRTHNDFPEVVRSAAPSLSARKSLLNRLNLPVQFVNVR